MGTRHLHTLDFHRPLICSVLCIWENLFQYYTYTVTFLCNVPCFKILPIHIPHIQHGLTGAETWLVCCDLNDGVWLSTRAISTHLETLPFAASITVQIMPHHRPAPPAKLSIRADPLGFELFSIASQYATNIHKHCPRYGTTMYRQLCVQLSLPGAPHLRTLQCFKSSCIFLNEVDGKRSWEGEGKGGGREGTGGGRGRGEWWVRGRIPQV